MLSRQMIKRVWYIPVENELPSYHRRSGTSIFQIHKFNLYFSGGPDSGIKIGNVLKTGESFVI